MPRKKTAPEIIAEALGQDWEDIKCQRYQSTRYSAPAVYSWDDEPWSYLCCPSGSQKPPPDFPWQRITTGPRPVFAVAYKDLKEA
jgi:hypothetical protein